MLTPLDLERDFGLTEGNIFQGELTLEQLFFLRPAPGWAQYKTPIASLYMCGSATHPGGGIMGAPGRNAAHAHPQRNEQEVVMADTIIIGAGHNALVTAFYLAKAGTEAAGARAPARRRRLRDRARTSRPGIAARRWRTRWARCGRRSSATCSSNAAA